MAEAATISSTNAKQVGKQLRAVRRRKGLSLSEVARGAGLSRRELVAYERGKVPIPESDLWVLAGSCGVDVGELVPQHGALALEAGPDSIGDTIAFLRRNQDTRSGRAVLALEAADATTPFYSGPQPAATPPVEQLVPEQFAPESFASADAPATAVPVDVFEELARLPEPLPLTSEPDDYPDLLAPPAFLTADTTLEQSSMASALREPTMADPVFAPPPGTYELVDDEPITSPPTASDGDVATSDFVGFDSPTVVDAAPDTVDRQWTPEDAPPIDVALRGETFNNSAWTTDWQSDAPTWETPDWERATSGVWNEPDAGSGPPAWSAGDTDHAPDVWGPGDAPATTPFANEVGIDDLVDANAVDAEYFGLQFVAEDEAEPPIGLITLSSYEDLRDLPVRPEPTAEHTQWPHEPDPEATSTGFLVDWGDPDAPITSRPGGATRRAIGDRLTGPAEEEIDETVELGGAESASPDDIADDAVEAIDSFEAAESDPIEIFDAVTSAEEPRPDEIAAPDATTAPISWHPEEASTAPAVAPAIEQAVEPAAASPATGEPGPDGWTTAGEDWELGNALPLVEVRGQGALVMRRADERWALADLTVSDRYLVEVELEFRAGPGFGVLFRADVDGDGRMSGYSFDVDPVYEGGGFLVRQWLADRELWNPVAHVPSDDPGSMYGNLTVRLEVLGERLVASVNDDVVMTVDDLEQGSIERGRTAPAGSRVGVQAWSSSDLVIETFRTADR